MNIPSLLSQQKAYFNSNTTKSVKFRVAQLKRLKRVIQAHESHLFEAIDQDFSKSEFEAYISELSLVYSQINTFIRNIGEWSEHQRVRTGLANVGGRSYIVPEPLGVTLVIGAWNYPIQLSLLPALTSLAAGNTVVMKPSELPSKTSAVLAKMINEHFAPEYFHVVEGGVKETSELLSHRFDKIFFTGSTEVGRIVYQAAAKHLTPVTLELGGKSPTFVMADCHVNMAVKRIAWAKFFNAGQTCVAPDYILVHRSIEEKFIQAMKDEISKYYADGEVADNYVQIINDRNFERLAALIDSSKVCLGGKAEAESRYISPTLLRDVRFEDEIMKDEIFGPILPIIAFDDLDAVIAEVKSRPTPLSCYVYTTSQKVADKVVHEISFGSGGVNESIMQLSNLNLPFGGVGVSGFGSYHGKAGFDTFTHYKSMMVKTNWFEPNIKYPPYSKWKLRLVKWLVG